MTGRAEKGCWEGKCWETDEGASGSQMRNVRKMGDREHWEETGSWGWSAGMKRLGERMCGGVLSRYQG